MAIIEAKRANTMYTRRRTTIYKDIHQRNKSAPKRHTKRNSIRIKATMVISRTNTSNILPSTKETIKINTIKPLKPLS